MPAPLALLYDADCGFCRWSLGWILAWDRRRELRPVALQDPEAARLLAGMGAQERMASAHVVDADGRILSGGDAAPAVLRRLPGGRPLAALCAAAPRVTRRLYRWTADHRGALGRLVGDRAATRARRRIAARG